MFSYKKQDLKKILGTVQHVKPGFNDVESLNIIVGSPAYIYLSCLRQGGRSHEKPAE